MKFNKYAISAACAGLLAAPAFASDIFPSADDVFAKWGEVEGYTIYKDETKGSCLAERIDEVGTVLQMGLTDSQEFGYLGVFTQSDIEAISEGDTIILSLDGEVFEATAHTKTSNLPDGYQGGYVLTNNPAFVEAVQRKYTMTVFPEQDYAFNVDLTGTFKAVEEARKCQSGM